MFVTEGSFEGQDFYTLTKYACLHSVASISYAYNLIGTCTTFKLIHISHVGSSHGLYIGFLTRLLALRPNKVQLFVTLVYLRPLAYVV
jgi:hypothetical protein